MKLLTIVFALGILSLSACQVTGGLLGRTIAEIDDPFVKLELFFET